MKKHRQWIATWGIAALLLIAPGWGGQVLPTAQAEALQQSRERTGQDRNRSSDARQRSTQRQARTQRRSDSRTQERRQARTQSRSEARTQESRQARSQNRSDARTQERRQARTQNRSEARTQDRRPSRTQNRSEARTQQRGRDARAAQRGSRDRAQSSRGQATTGRSARSTPRSRTGQRSSSSAPRATNRGVTSPRGSAAPARRSSRVVVPRRPAPPPPRVVQYTTLRPRKAYFSSFNLSIYINRVITQRPRVIVRTFDQRAFAYEIGQEFVRDFLPRNARVRFPRFRPNSRSLVVEYLGAGEYFIAGTMRVREPGFRGWLREDFELVIKDRRGGWELLEIFLESY